MGRLYFAAPPTSQPSEPTLGHKLQLQADLSISKLSDLFCVTAGSQGGGSSNIHTFRVLRVISTSLYVGKACDQYGTQVSAFREKGILHVLSTYWHTYCYGTGLAFAFLAFDSGGVLQSLLRGEGNCVLFQRSRVCGLCVRQHIPSWPTASKVIAKRKL